MKVLITLVLFAGFLSAQTKPRVLLTDHAVNVSEVSQNDNVQALGVNAELLNNLTKNCKEITITTNGSKADYIVFWKETTHSSHNYDYSVFNRDGDLIGNGSTNLKGTAAKEICKMVMSAKK